MFEKFNTELTKENLSLMKKKLKYESKIIITRRSRKRN